MPSISDDFQMPIMYQDLRNPSMGMLPGFGMYTNYLGGIKLPRELQDDKFVLQNRKKKERNTIKAAALILIGLASALALKNGSFVSWVTKQCSGIKGWFKGLIKTKPPVPPTGTP